MRHAVILAGGSGTRLWPASRRACPKQFRRVTRDGETLIEGALARAHAIAGDLVSIVTADELAEVTRHVAPGVEVLVEPAARNTGAAIGLAVHAIVQRDPYASIAVLPADHYVRAGAGMTDAIKWALSTAELTDAIALVGIKPTRPETGYGYLELDMMPIGKLLPAAEAVGTVGWPVARFIEKPCLADAERFVTHPRYLWNAGIFCFTAKRAIVELDRHLPAIGQALRDGPSAYVELPSISFDKGVLEKTDRIVGVPADVGWSDVGSWAAIAEVRDRDARGNVVDDAAVAIDCEDSVVLSDGAGLVAAIGVRGLVVVKHGDAVLVVRKDQAQRVREVVEALGARGFEKYL